MKAVYFVPMKKKPRYTNKQVVKAAMIAAANVLRRVESGLLFEDLTDKQYHLVRKTLDHIADQLSTEHFTDGEDILKLVKTKKI